MNPLCLDSIKPGQCLIFGQKEFTNLTNIPGIENEELAMQTSLTRCGMEVTPHRNKNAEEIKKIIVDFSQSEFGKEQMAVVVFSTHGSSNNVLHASDGTIDLDRDVIKVLVKSEKLKHRPIWIIINACRGVLEDKMVELSPTVSSRTTTTETQDTGPNLHSMISEVHEHKDLLLFYCSTHGRVGYGGSGGSIFITKLAEQLENWSDKIDLLSILENVTNDVVYVNLDANVAGTILGETPCFLSFLPYQVFLRRPTAAVPTGIEYQTKEFQGKAFVGVQMQHKRDATDLINVLNQLNFNTKLVQYQKPESIEETLNREIVGQVSADHTMCALVLFITGCQDDQKLGPVLRELLLANQSNKMAEKPRVIILINLKKENVVVLTEPSKTVGLPTRPSITFITEHADVLIFYCRGKETYLDLLVELRNVKDKSEGLVSMFTRINAAALGREATRVNEADAGAVGAADKTLSIIQSTLTKKLVIKSTPRMCPDYVRTATIANQ